MAHSSVLSPEEPKVKVPVSKMALLVLVALIVILALTTTLLKGGVKKAEQKEPVVKQTQGVGLVADIEREEELAAKGRSPAASEVRPVVGSGGAPLPLGMTASATEPTGPAEKGKRVASSSMKDQATDSVDAEIENERRKARSLVIDDSKTALFDDSNQVPEKSPQNVYAPKSAGTESPKSKTSDLLAAYEKLAANGDKKNTSWLQDYENQPKGSAKGITTSKAPTGDRILHQGKVIPAVLGRKVNSDLPGVITAYTSINVYDSMGKGDLLIPKGSALVGRYDSNINMGQERMMFAFERLITPDGLSFDLPAASGSDLEGSAGVTGDVNNHFLKMFGTSLLIAVIADKTRPEQTGTNIGSTGITDAAGAILADVSQRVLQNSTIMKPTITIDQGTKINVEVVRDMVFPRANNR